MKIGLKVRNLSTANRSRHLQIIIVVVVNSTFTFKFKCNLAWARSTLVTKLNSTRSTLLKVDCCRNRQQIGNKVDCCRICSTLLPIRSTLLPIRSTLSPECTGAKATRSTLLTFNNVDRVEFNLVASAYRPLQPPGRSPFYGAVGQNSTRRDPDPNRPTYGTKEEGDDLGVVLSGDWVVIISPGEMWRTRGWPG